jgi:hypothetical protein
MVRLKNSAAAGLIGLYNPRQQRSGSFFCAEEGSQVLGVEDEGEVLNRYLVSVIYEPLGREDPAGPRTFGSDPCHSREKAAFASLPAQ